MISSGWVWPGDRGVGARYVVDADHERSGRGYTIRSVVTRAACASV